MKIKKILGTAVNKAGYTVVSNNSLTAIRQRLAEVEESKRAIQLLGLIQAMQVSDVARFIKFGNLSGAQLLQDLFVLEQLSFKEGGYFVEFGAADGIRHSNTYLLEKEFGWNGILAEPATIWHKTLSSTRSAKIDTRCVWSESNEIVEFSEDMSAELSSATQDRNQGIHEKRRIDAKRYRVITVSLNDLLVGCQAPIEIDYLSIDTEGSEYRIMKAFDWNKFRFRVITVEHNFSEERGLISELLRSVGYRQVYPELSKFDDWYVYEGMDRF